MPSKPKQPGLVRRKNMDSAVELAESTIENLQSIAAIQIKVAGMLFQSNVDCAKAIVTANAPQQAVALRTQNTRKKMQILLDAAGEITEIGNASRTEFSHMLAEKLVSGSKEMMASFQAFFGTLPGQNPALVDHMQNAMSQISDALAQLTDTTTVSCKGDGKSRARGE